MMTITEKAAYIKGLVEGLELDESKKETKVIKALVDIVDELALLSADHDDQIALINDAIDDAEEHLDTVDSDLSDLEDFVYSTFDEDYESFDDECDFDCEDCDFDCDSDDDEEYEYEVDCPECGKSFCFDDSVFDSDEPLTCPECGYVIDEIEIEDGEDGE